mmetsp:Transcript_45511/g.150843  ORF Transcript_45511/g.150843 Transcript_45511/m.150843 type:complete len:211 (-) Transcript_45511:221-853(-)
MLLRRPSVTADTWCISRLDGKTTASPARSGTASGRPEGSPLASISGAEPRTTSNTPPASQGSRQTTTERARASSKPGGPFGCFEAGKASRCQLFLSPTPYDIACTFSYRTRPEENAGRAPGHFLAPSRTAALSLLNRNCGQSPWWAKQLQGSGSSGSKSASLSSSLSSSEPASSAAVPLLPVVSLLVAAALARRGGRQMMRETWPTWRSS